MAEKCDAIRLELVEAQARVGVLTNTLAECEATPEPPVPSKFTRRGYVIQQVSSKTECLNYRDEFVNVHSTVPAVNGGGIRVPWKSYAADKSILQAGADISQPFEHYSIRIMAGKHTPSNQMGVTLTEGGVTYPSPFADNSGNPNMAFVNNQKAVMMEWAKFLTETGQSNPILHWSWYAKEWAEIYYGPAVQQHPGNRKVNGVPTKFIEAQCALITAAAEVQKAYPKVIQEFPLSGHGPIQSFVDDMTRCVSAAFEDQRAAIQANGWSHSGQWGQSNPDADRQMDSAFAEAWSSNTLIGVQAIQPWGQASYPQYTATQATAAFAQADAAKANYFEIYTPTFLSANGGSVWKTPVANWLAG
jgi:hypothetical protein